MSNNNHTNNIVSLVSKKSVYLNIEFLSLALLGNNMTLAKDKPKLWLCNVDYTKFINPEPKVAYLLGLLWGDGHLFNNRTRGVVIESVSEDMNEFEPLFDLTGKWSKSTRTRKGKKKTYTILRAVNLSLFNYLSSYDYQEKSFKTATIINVLNDDIKKYWWRGYFDADGCMYINPKRKTFQLCFASTYAQDWSFVESKFRELDCKYSIVRRIKPDGTKYSTITISRRKDCLIFLNYIYDGELFGLTRKYKKFQDALNIAVNYGIVI